MNFQRKMVDINSWPRVTWITCYMAAQPIPCCTPYIIIIIIMHWFINFCWLLFFQTLDSFHKHRNQTDSQKKHRNQT